MNDTKVIHKIALTSVPSSPNKVQEVEMSKSNKLKPSNSNSQLPSRKSSKISRGEPDELIEIIVKDKWKVVRKHLPRIVVYGRKEGLLGHVEEQQISDQNKGGASSTENEEREKEKKDEDVIKVLTEDSSLAHSAIPFLPVPVAIICLALNICLPGTGMSRKYLLPLKNYPSAIATYCKRNTQACREFNSSFNSTQGFPDKCILKARAQKGTILSGIATMCLGQPRLIFKEGRIFMTVLINMLVGISQFVTVTFMLVGWFWSMAWGGLMLMHSLEYRSALMQRRQEAVATAAIEALTKDAILRKRDVRNLVQESNNEKNATRKSSVGQTIQSKFSRKGTKKDASNKA